MSDVAPHGVIDLRGPAGAPAVLLLHPWWGITPAVMGWADELVTIGRRVVLPDLYGGRTASTIEGAQALQKAMDEDAALRLVERCADELAADAQPWAAMGFSMGAFLACHLAGRGTAGPAELVLFYGGQPPDGDIRTRLVSLHLAPGDEWFTGEEVTATEEAFRSAGAEVKAYEYPGSGHWFAERDSPGFDERAAELARSRVIGQLRP